MDRSVRYSHRNLLAMFSMLSVLVTVAFSYFVFGEKLSKRSMAGLVLLTAGTVAMAML